jgi:hypothetical protein
MTDSSSTRETHKHNPKVVITHVFILWPLSLLSVANLNHQAGKLYDHRVTTGHVEITTTIIIIIIITQINNNK